MRVLLISANREEINMRTWPLGTACVAASTRQAGHEVLLVDLMQADEPASAVKRAVAEFRPEVIGLSVRNVDDQTMTDTKFFLDEVKQIVNVCRSVSNAAIVLGGAGYSIFPHSLLEYLGADMGIQGEGETALPSLLERLEKRADLSGVPGLYLLGSGLVGTREYEKDLDRFPLPDPALLAGSVPKTADFWLPVQTRRGCPMNCSYCSTGTIEGCILRKRSPKLVVQWISEVARTGLRQFYFVDNTFNLPPSYAGTLCAELAAARLGIIWRCIIYPNRIDPKLAQLMAEAGCREVSLGFESGSELVLHGMHKRFKPQNVREASALLGRHGIRRMGFLMLGGPGETRETALESLAFADSLRLEAMKVTVGIRIYPYTALAQTAVADGLISADDDLLSPRFYMVPGLEDWLRETVAEWMAERPNWMS